jgi:hypothetical protein
MSPLLLIVGSVELLLVTAVFTLWLDKTLHRFSREDEAESGA